VEEKVAKIGKGSSDLGRLLKLKKKLQRQAQTAQQKEWKALERL
jgi:hypothetical protein